MIDLIISTKYLKILFICKYLLFDQKGSNCLTLSRMRNIYFIDLSFFTQCLQQFQNNEKTLRIRKTQLHL